MSLPTAFLFCHQKWRKKPVFRDNLSRILPMAKLLLLTSRMIFKKKTKMDEKMTQQEQAAEENAENIENIEAAAQEGEVKEENTAVSELDQLRAELNEMKDKNLRLVAEFDNFRKRSAKERIDLIATAGKDIVQSLLDVVDDSYRAMKQMDTDNDAESVKEGARLVFNKLQHTLQQKGLKAMDCQGKEFDADLHEAITEIPAPTEEMKGKIIDVVQAGYYLNDKLIRHAKVVVGA